MPPTQPITAAVLRHLGQPLSIERLDMEGPQEDEVLARLVASGICHTDIDLWESRAGGPVVLDHEGAGNINQAIADSKGGTTIKPMLRFGAAQAQA